MVYRFYPVYSRICTNQLVQLTAMDRWPAIGRAREVASPTSPGESWSWISWSVPFVFNLLAFPSVPIRLCQMRLVANIPKDLCFATSLAQKSLHELTLLPEIRMWFWSRAFVFYWHSEFRSFGQGLQLGIFGQILTTAKWHFTFLIGVSAIHTPGHLESYVPAIILLIRPRSLRHGPLFP